MTIDVFIQTLQEKEIPTTILDLPQADLLTALWYDGKGDWENAHQIAQTKETAFYCLVHAYLHRKEGDQWNAAYWYRRAGRAAATVSLWEEWKEITKELLG